MIQLIHFKNDIKQIMRDPIMAILLVAPLFLIVLFKLMVLYLIPFIDSQIGFNATPYLQYVLSFVLLVNSGILGIVTGFMMLDERDGNIAELMSITPLGRSGYLINRLSFASGLAFIYGILSCYVLNIAELQLHAILFLSLLSALYTAIIGLLIYSGAGDKVKGLTFAKGLNSLVLFAFTDLLSLEWLIVLSWFFPPYWVTAIIKSPDSYLQYGVALFVNICWLVILIVRYWKKKS